ncbi:hypothetical protein HGP28_18335 [Vibrio sp. SM6]|uniref:Uncharacterized protein n=1 Tax=Vibrio agarilyticus TaxID=2726741 RepID=A0A7X8TU33_9VIBR|nr:hypothetical protein [Vibrio agarilyticus]NLS14820.1 hypothetical protein [Vibrio agarilyticus]
MKTMTLAQQLKIDIFTALRQNAKPGVALQCFALLIAVSYFYWPDAQRLFSALAAMKAEFGWVYSAIATALFGGVIPVLLLRTLGYQAADFGIELVCVALFWAYKGVEVDLFYQLQSWLFGSKLDVATVVTKVVVDQFIYSAFWSVPTIAVFYLWKDLGFPRHHFLKYIDKEFWLRRVFAMTISNWLIWIPAVCVIYMMPADLQLPLFNIVLLFFGMLVAVLSKNERV